MFADLLQGVRRVTVAGYASSRIHPLAIGRRVEIVATTGRSRPDSGLRKRLRGATAIVSKPLFRSWGWALLDHLRPVLLDIDDPELELATADARTFASASLGVMNPAVTLVLQSLRSRADAISVSNSELQRRFGGWIIPHARDEADFGDDTRDRASARRAVGVAGDRRVVVFVGTVRHHKGLETLYSAARHLKDIDFAIVGSTSVDGAPPNVRSTPPVPYALARTWLAAADVVVVPQLMTRVTVAQSPAKLVDAMAMGRAAVVSDLAVTREIAGDTVLFVEPGSVESLRVAVRSLIDDRAMREALEERTRRRFLDTLSVRAVRPKLLELLARAESTHA